MKIKTIIYTGFISAGIFLSTPLTAAGFGGYIANSYGPYKTEYSSADYLDTKFNLNSYMYRIGVGFVFDTTVAYDRLFNYRVQQGCSLVYINNEKNAPDIEGYEIHMYHSFGFGIIRNENMRIWIGPQIGYGYMEGSYKINYDNDTNEFYSVFVTVGAVAGLNYNIGNRYTIGVDGGYRFCLNTGGSDIGDYSYDTDGKGHDIFMNVFILIRVADTFSGE